MLIPFQDDLDIESTLESGQVFRWERINSRPVNNPWFRGVIFGNLVQIQQNQHGIEFNCTPAKEIDLLPTIKNYFRLQDDLSTIYKYIGLDNRIKSSISEYPGMRILNQDPWECLISFICSSASNIPKISRNIESLCSTFGEPIRVKANTYYSFPTPNALASATEFKIRNLGLGFRSRYVSKVSEIVASGKFDLYSLKHMPYQEALNQLILLPGVGDKVANCVLLFSLNKLEAFPVDVWIQRVIKEWYSPLDPNLENLPDSKLRYWAQNRFGQYSGYANHYLFHKRRLQGNNQ
ncbi:MAG: DNA glycosylase [Chloroflexota bacterium]|nr:DNA glycosylase [Chloroflexota bacterium]